MKDEDKRKLIEDLDKIRYLNAYRIDNLEMVLSEMKEDNEKLIQILMNLKSKVKNDEET